MSSDNKDLVGVVASLSSNSLGSKSSQLDRHASDLGTLVDKGVSSGIIQAGLEVIGVKVSGTYLRDYLKENFPASYAENYTKKRVGGRKKGKKKEVRNSKEIIGEEVCQQKKSSSKKQDVSKGKNNMTQAKGKSSEESSSMVQDYLNENKSK